jgi:hypothetical protein
MREIIITLLLFTSTAATAQTQDWQPLFNGRDLTGWRANNNPESFTVVEGAICTHPLSTL